MQTLHSWTEFLEKKFILLFLLSWNFQILKAAFQEFAMITKFGIKGEEIDRAK